MGQLVAWRSSNCLAGVDTDGHLSDIALSAKYARQTWRPSALPHCFFLVALAVCLANACRDTGRTLNLRSAPGDRITDGRCRLATCLHRDRKSTRLNSVTNAHLVCRLLLEK